MSPEDRSRILAGLEAFAESQPGLDPRSERQALLAQVQLQPEVEASGIAKDGSVWGRFADGRWMVFPVPMEPLETTALGEPPKLLQLASSEAAKALQAMRPLSSLGAAHGRARVSADAVGGGLPESKTAMLLTALDPAVYGNEEDTIKRMLEDGGYQVISDEMTIDWLKAVRDVGVLSLDTHGGLAGNRRPEEPGATPSLAGGEGGSAVYALGTATLYTEENDRLFQTDLDLARLVYVFVDEAWRYGITGNFVRSYMTLSKGSFVYLGACSSYDADMLESFRQVGASVLAGWTYPVKAVHHAAAAKTIFDLLLGNGGFVTESKPLNRPFDYIASWEYLQRNGLDHSFTKARGDPNADWTGETPEPSGGNQQWINSYLRYEQLNPGFRLLAPSIRNLEVQEEDRTLIVNGIFGPDPGAENRLVTIDGTQVFPASDGWTPEKITLDLPKAEKAGGAGDVVVEVRGHKSNAVPLTLWRTQLRYEARLYPPNLQQAITYNVLLRADIHPYREKPGQELIDPDVPLTAYAPDSSGTWAWSGSGVMDDLTWTCNGSGTLPMMDAEEDQEDFLNGGFHMTAQDQALVLKTDAYITSEGSWCEMSATGVSEHLPFPISTFLDPMWSPLEIQLDEGYQGEAGERNGNTINGEATEFFGMLEWDAVQPEHLPTDATRA